MRRNDRVPFASIATLVPSARPAVTSSAVSDPPTTPCVADAPQMEQVPKSALDGGRIQSLDCFGSHAQKYPTIIVIISLLNCIGSIGKTNRNIQFYLSQNRTLIAGGGEHVQRQKAGEHGSVSGVFAVAQVACQMCM